VAGGVAFLLLAVGAFQREQIGAYDLTVITWLALDEMRGVFALGLTGIITHLAKGLYGLLAIAAILACTDAALLALAAALLGITHFLFKKSVSVCLFVCEILYPYFLKSISIFCNFVKEP
jgi:hypothetical protein